LTVTLSLAAGENKFLSSKVIAVMGEFRAVGKPKLKSWSRLNATAAAGQRTLTIRDTVAWDVGDQIVVSPTGYFGSEGELWSDARGGVEVHTITQIVQATKSKGTVITLASPLNQTHLCIAVEGESFCGAVGVLTRNIRITSVQSEDPTSASFGFGGHIAVIDLVKGVDGVSSSFSGFVTFKSVEFRNQGKLNSDHYAISFDYSAAHTPSIIMNCSFVHGYSMAVRAGN